MFDFLKFYDPDVAGALNDGFASLEAALDKIREVIDKASPETNNEELVAALNKIQDAIDRQSLALTLSRNEDGESLVNHKNIETLTKEICEARWKVWDKKDMTDDSNHEQFEAAFKNGKLSEMKEVLDAMDFAERKKAYSDVLLPAMAASPKYYNAAVAEFRTGQTFDADSHFHKKCKDEDNKEHDGYDLHAHLVQELVLHIYTTTKDYEDESGANLMDVGAVAKADKDGNDAYNMAKDMLRSFCHENRFDRNSDVKGLFAFTDNVTDDMKEDLGTFTFDEENIDLFDTVDEAGLDVEIA